MYLVVWSGGYDTPQYEARETRLAAAMLAHEWAQDMREGEDTIDVIAINPGVEPYRLSDVQAGAWPLPNDQLGPFTVLASCVYREADKEIDHDIQLVLLLGPAAPYYTVALVHGPEWTVGHNGEKHHNIVHAVEAYKEWGGDV